MNLKIRQRHMAGYCNKNGLVGWTEIHIKPNDDVVIFFNSNMLLDYSNNIKRCVYSLNNVIFQSRLCDEKGISFYDGVDILDWLKKNGANLGDKTDDAGDKKESTQN